MQKVELTSQSLVLTGAEAAGSILIFGRPFWHNFVSYGTVASALGLAGQIAFGLIPVVQSMRGKASRTPHQSILSTWFVCSIYNR